MTRGMTYTKLRSRGPCRAIWKYKRCGLICMIPISLPGDDPAQIVRFVLHPLPSPFAVLPT
eukprot:959761-Rhodomonas_salina.4